LNQEKGANSVIYEIYGNPENEIEILSTKLSEVEELINNIEKSIGNWDIVNLLVIQYNNNESISLCLTKLLNFSATKLNERYDKKFQTIKEFGNLINTFMEKKKDKIVTGSYYLKVRI
jgi:predicted RNA-binding protein with RPS1 domain